MQQIQHNTGELAQSMAAQFRETHRATSGVLVLMIFSVLPLTSLIIGAIRINECSIQRMIPIWLTVIGAAGIVLLSILATLIISQNFCCYKNDESKRRNHPFILCISVAFWPILLFYIAWLIAGFVWIFSVKSKVQFNEPISSNYCHRSAYNFAFGFAIIQLCFSGLMGCLFCCLCCFACINLGRTNR